MAEMSRVTPSGVRIPDSEYRAIEKAARQDTIKTVLAVVGVGALFVLVRGWLDTSKSDSNDSD